MNKNRINTILDYNNILVDIYNDEDLKCLSDNNSIHFEQNIRSTEDQFNDLRQFLLNEYKIEGSKYYAPNYLGYFFFDAKSEIITVSSEIKYRIGTVLLYYPYLERVNEYLDHDLYSRRFHFELPIAYEALYKFWQRLSDYLLAYFPDAQFDNKGKKIKRTYFHKPLDYIENNYPHLTTSINYQWIKDFWKNDYNQLNDHRKKFVHKSGYVVSFYDSFRKAKAEEEKNKLNLERPEHVNFLLAQSSRTIVGYLKFMNFLSELVILKNKHSKFEYSFK